MRLVTYPDIPIPEGYIVAASDEPGLMKEAWGFHYNGGHHGWWSDLGVNSGSWNYERDWVFLKRKK